MGEEQVCKERIVEYLDHFNRPFNANNIVDEFAKKFKKSVITRAIESLEVNGEIQVIAFGKIKLFLADQRKFRVPSEEELEQLDKNILDKEDTLATLQEQSSTLVSSNETLAATPSDAEIHKLLLEHTEKLTALRAQLKRCKGMAKGKGEKEEDDEEEEESTLDKKELDAVVKAASNMCTARKRKCLRIIQDLEVRTGRAKEDLMDTIGVEDDA